MRKRYPSVVLTSACASMRVCHLRTSDFNLSLVNDIPEKFVRQFFPWTSSTRSLILRNACSSSFCKSASETSKIRPLRASLADFRPVDRLTRVFPTCLTSKIPGALTSYLKKNIRMNEEEENVTSPFVSKGLRPSSLCPSFPWKDACSYQQPRMR